MICAATAIIAVSCAKEQTSSSLDNTNLVFKTFTAHLDDVSTKTSLVEGQKVYWLEGDKISVFDNFTTVTNGQSGKDQIKYVNQEFTSTNLSGVKADFTGYANDNATEYLAVYPFMAGTQYNGEIRVDLDQTQNFVAGGFDTNTNVMVAKTNTDYFSFKNLCGLVKVNVPSDVKAVTLMSDQYISGKFRVSFNEDYSVKELKGINNDNTYRDIILRKKDGNAFSGECYFVVAPGKHNFMICFTDKDGKMYSYSARSQQELKANQVLDLGGPQSLSDSDVSAVSYYKASIIDNVVLNVPDGTTLSSSYSRVIAGLDNSTKTVTLGKWPGTAIVRATTDDKVYPIFIEAIPAYRDDENMLRFWGATTGDRKGENFSYEEMTSNNETYIKVTSIDAKYSCLRRSQKAWFAPELAPLVAFRITEPSPVDESKTLKSYSFKVDLQTYQFSGQNYYGELGGGNKTWGNVYTCSDGSKIYVYDLSSQALSCGYKLPVDFVGDPNNLTIKYCDFKDQNGQESKVSFNFYWFRTYASWADFDAHLAEWRKQTGLDAQWGNEYKK